MMTLGDSFTTCAGGLGIMKAGDTCTLPDGSNIGVWNGAQLTNPAGGSIDSANGAQLVAQGWPATQIAGQGTPWLTIIGAVVGGVSILLLLSMFLGGKKAPTSTTTPTEATP